jgi:hypothetical protein
VFILAALLPMTLQGIVLRVCFAASIVWGIAAPFAKGDMQTSVSRHATKNCVRSKAMQMHGQVRKPFFHVYCTTSAPANCFSGCSGGISSPQCNDAMAGAVQQPLARVTSTCGLRGLCPAISRWGPLGGAHAWYKGGMCNLSAAAAICQQLLHCCAICQLLLLNCCHL